MDQSTSTTTLPRLVGDNLRRVREDNGEESHDETARQVQDYGLPWTRKVVAAVEAGERSVDLVELLLLSLVYEKDLAWWVTSGGGQVSPHLIVELNDAVRVPQEVLHSALAGDSWHTWRDFHRWDTPSRRRLAESSSLEEWIVSGPTVPSVLDDPVAVAATGVAEQKAARTLGMDAHELSELAHLCWGQSLTMERDARVADELPKDAPRRTRQAIRGHVTRELLAELKAYQQAEEAKSAKSRRRKETS